jgi:hypothetical protein
VPIEYILHSGHALVLLDAVAATRCGPSSANVQCVLRNAGKPFVLAMHRSGPSLTVYTRKQRCWQQGVLQGLGHSQQRVRHTGIVVQLQVSYHTPCARQLVAAEAGAGELMNPASDSGCQSSMNLAHHSLLFVSAWCRAIREGSPCSSGT